MSTVAPPNLRYLLVSLDISKGRLYELYSSARVWVKDSGLSPYVAGVRAQHGLSRLAAPSLLELGHVLHYTVDTIFPGRVRVNADPHARELGALLLAPHSPKPQEETLFRSVAVDLLSLFAGLVIRDHVLEGDQRDARTAIVGGVLAQSEAPIQLEIVHRHKAAIFIRNATDALLKFLAILL